MTNDQFNEMVRIRDLYERGAISRAEACARLRALGLEC